MRRSVGVWGGMCGAVLLLGTVGAARADLTASPA